MHLSLIYNFNTKIENTKTKKLKGEQSKLCMYFAWLGVKLSLK